MNQQRLEMMETLSLNLLYFNTQNTAYSEEVSI